MRKIVKIFLAFLLMLFLCGCNTHSAPATTGPQCRVVTEVTVLCQNGSVSCRRYYTDDEKVRRILNYLRQIAPYGTPQEDPALLTGNDIYIVLTCSDDSKKIYHQKADLYMMIDNGPWENIDPRRAKELSAILGEMESDGEIPTADMVSVGFVPQG